MSALDRCFWRAFPFATVMLLVFLEPVQSQTTGVTQAGVAAAVHGKVQQVSLALQPQAERGPAVGHLVASGDRIFLNDRIATGPQAGLQIMLMDESIFTIGPNAEMVIDKFVYDPDRDTGEVAASIVKGAFRFVSGRIAKRNPSDMNLRVGTAALGIRGTVAAGNVSNTLPDGSPGETVDVVLLGPGPDNNADERDGRITLSNGGSGVEISRPGFGTTIVGSNGTPQPPVRWSPEKLGNVTGQLTSRGGGGGTNGGDNDGNGGNANNRDNAASDTGEESTNAAQFNTLSGQSIALGQEISVEVGSLESVSEVADEIVTDSTTATVSQLSTITTVDELRSISSGSASFTLSAVPLIYLSGPLSGNGQFDAQIDIDFAQRSASVGVNNVSYVFTDGSGSYPGSFTYLDQTTGADYDGDTGLAVSTGNSAINPSEFPTAPNAGATATVVATLNNNVQTGEIASTATVAVAVEFTPTGFGGGSSVIAGAATAPSVLSSP